MIGRGARKFMKPSMERWALKLVYDENKPGFKEKIGTLVEDKPVQAEPNWDNRDEFYSKNVDSWRLYDEKFWIAKEIHSAGTLDPKQLYARYSRDTEIDKNQIKIKSLSHLRKWLKEMKLDKEILKAGYSSRERRYLGYVVNPYIVFSKYHPGLVYSLDPVPECEIKEHYSKLAEDANALETSEDNPEIVNEKKLSS